MTIARVLGTTLALVSVLGLAGCSTAVEEDTASTMVETVTEAQPSPISPTDEAMPAPTPGNAVTPEAPGTPAPVADPADPTATDIPDVSELPPDPVGKEVTIAGVPATVCIYGDGWGTNIWAGNANTSCEFVVAVHKELIEGLNPTSDNIRQNLKPTITVTSPITQQNYDLTCVQRSEMLMSCTGGANATVFFY